MQQQLERSPYISENIAKYCPEAAIENVKTAIPIIQQLFIGHKNIPTTDYTCYFCLNEKLAFVQCKKCIRAVCLDCYCECIYCLRNICRLDSWFDYDKDGHVCYDCGQPK